MYPQFHNLAEFMAMGKHGIYVWSCWLFFIIILVGLVFYSIRQRRLLIQQLNNQHARMQAAKSNSTKSNNKI